MQVHIPRQRLLPSSLHMQAVKCSSSTERRWQALLRLNNLVRMVTCQYWCASWHTCGQSWTCRSSSRQVHVCKYEAGMSADMSAAQTLISSRLIQTQQTVCLDEDWPLRVLQAER